MSEFVEKLSEEQKQLLLGLGLPALMEIRLLELDGAEAAIEGVQPDPHKPWPEDCNLRRTHTVLRGTLYGTAVGKFLLARGLLEHVHGQNCAHVRLTEWGRTFITGVINNNNVMGR